MTRLTVKPFTSLTEVRRFRDELNALNLSSRRPCPFSTVEYLETFLAHDEHGASERELLMLTAWDSDQLVGSLSLRRHRVPLGAGLGYQRVGVMVSHDTDRPHVVSKPEDEARCARAFYEHLAEERGWSLLELNFQDAESALLTPPPLPPNRFWVRRYENMPISRARLDWPDVSSYLQHLSKSSRRLFARSVRRTVEAGHAEVVSSSDPGALPALLELYLGVERRSWKHAAHAGIGRSPRRVAFFQDLARPGQPMRITVHLVLVDALPVSGAITGAFGGVLHGFEMCFDQDYEALNCGHLSGLVSLRQAIHQGMHEFNLNGNYAYNKVHYGAEVTPTWALQVFRVGGLPWLKAQAGRVRHGLTPGEEAVVDFNPERREHQARGAERPLRVEERAHTRAVLAELEARGVRLERLAGPALARALGGAGGTQEAA
jgi:hypothetical protein